MKIQQPILASLVIALTLVGAPVRAQSRLTFTLAAGKYAVGFRAVEQFDRTRTFGDAYDEDGKPVVGDRARPIQTSIWYPAQTTTTSPRMRYREYVDLFTRPGTLPAHDAASRLAAERLFSTIFGGVDSAKLARELNAPTHAVRDASPARGSFPVIIYGPSLGAPSFENDVLMEYLASFGYIVVASPSWGRMAR